MSYATVLLLPIVNITNFTNLSSTTQWTFMPCIFTTITALALLVNSLVMITFLADPTLRTPFNLYLINLFIANLLCTVIQSSLEIFNYSYAHWWLGSAVCTMYLYSSYVLEAAVGGAHLLIIVNRVWAVTLPHSYRTRHNRLTAVLLCVGMWVYVHIVLLPFITNDALYYRLPLDIYGCTLNSKAQKGFAILVQIVIFNNPQALMLLGLVIILWKRRLRNKRLSRRVELCSKSDPNVTPRRFVCLSNQSEEATMAKRESKAYIILALLTVSAVICWTTLDTFYTIGIFYPTLNIDHPLYYQVAATLHAVQVALDAILFMISSRSLRQSFCSLFQLQWRS
jgi:hypothetical protein